MQKRSFSPKISYSPYSFVLAKTAPGSDVVCRCLPKSSDTGVVANTKGEEMMTSCCRIPPLLLVLAAPVAESVCSFADFKVESAVSCAVAAVSEALSFVEFQVHVALSLAAFEVPVAFSCAAPTASEDLSFAAPQPEAAESVISRAFSWAELAVSEAISFVL